MRRLQATLAVQYCTSAGAGGTFGSWQVWLASTTGLTAVSQILIMFKSSGMLSLQVAV